MVSLSLPIVNSPAGTRRMGMPFASMNSLGSGVDVIVDKGLAVVIGDGETTLAQAVKETKIIRENLFTLDT